MREIADINKETAMKERNENFLFPPPLHRQLSAFFLRNRNSCIELAIFYLFQIQLSVVLFELNLFKFFILFFQKHKMQH